MSFVDDLPIFTAANLPTINLVKEGLKEFKVASSLDINPSKSEVFFLAVPQDVKWKILDVLQFKEGTLLVRYLGLPLISGRLRLKDCQPLIDKIQGRIKSWSLRKLSFASRLQLLQSILYSIQRFWSSNFILPKKVIKSLEQNFNHFLWQGQGTSKGKTKVAWEKVCLRKREGGLGLQRVASWNRAAIMKHIWSLFTKARSLWVAWIHANLLKGKCFCSLKIPQECT